MGVTAMSKFGGFLARKTGLIAEPTEPKPAVTTPPDNTLELDEELFSALGTQIGGENELLRNLLLDANAKIGELNSIKSAVGRLVDPVGKTLRALETEKSERVGLQTVLNNTRTAYGKLRNEVAELEKKAANSETECRALRHELGTTQNLLRTIEATKAEIAIDVAARRAQVIDLEARLAQETGESTALRDENRRLDDRLVNTDKRIIALESDLNTARQRLLLGEDEKRAQQSSLDKVSSEAAKLSRKLAETEASLNAAQGRLRHVEANLAEIVNERARLVSALDEANERHDHELTSQRTRFDALQARASALENLMCEAREHLLARAEEIREYERRTQDIAVVTVRCPCAIRLRFRSGDAHFRGGVQLAFLEHRGFAGPRLQPHGRAVRALGRADAYAVPHTVGAGLPPRLCDRHGEQGVLEHRRVRSRRPYINSLIARYGLATNFYGETHPSEPNYIAMTSGGLQGTNSDGTVRPGRPEPLRPDRGVGPDLARVRPGLSRANCYTGSSFSAGVDGPGAAGEYVRKHNPAISYTSISGNPTRCANITGLAGFDPAAADFEFIVPNQINDMHSSSTAAGDAFLKAFVPKITDSAAFAGSVLFITWDEGDSSLHGGGHIATIVVTPGMTPGSRHDALSEPLLDAPHDRAGVGHAVPRPGRRRPMP